jgi:type I restriction enzyme S subunit
MTSPLLLEHFNELISTPDDVEKLNNSILQLAMQGKLVEQENGNWNENDVKLALAKEIQDFIDAGKITKPSKITPISESDIPIDKPNNWLCIRLGECLGLVNGRAYKQSELLDNGTPVIRIQNLNGGDRWYYSDLELPPEKYCDTNDLLFAWSASFGPYIWEGSRAIFHYHIWKIEHTSYIDKKYAYFLLKYLTEQVRGASHGLAMLHITKQKMENWVIVLPPLPEQQRIVTRIEELFAQTRRLAEELSNSRTELDLLNESALARLLPSARARRARGPRRLPRASRRAGPRLSRARLYHRHRRAGRQRQDGAAAGALPPAARRLQPGGGDQRHLHQGGRRVPGSPPGARARSDRRGRNRRLSTHRGA